ncbi:MAG TPA: YceI family protein [Caulobacteraceae bacterium]|jgi:polyisoprenoid-binding protein YceI
MNSKVSFRAAALGGLCALALAATAGGQGMPQPAHDYKAAPAGKYALDPKHTALVVRISHGGFSYSIFRFNDVTGALTWDPANPGADSLTASVDPKSIITGPVPGFSDELSGERFLNAAKFATATFTSTAFKPDGPAHGKVEGSLTIMGVTKPAVFDVDLVGAGKGFRGPVIGVTAKTQLDAKDFGLPAFMGGAPIEIIIDSEFDATT